MRAEEALRAFDCVSDVRKLLKDARELPEVRLRARVVKQDAHRPRHHPVVLLKKDLPKPPRARQFLKKLKQPVVLEVEHVLVQQDELGDRLREAQGARALLLEIFRRAAYDWVLYRSSRRIDQKQLAEDAYNWIFVEDEGDATWRSRKAEDKVLTSFSSICENLDLDPSVLRRHVRALTPQKVISSGRPPENSRATEQSKHIEVHTSLPDSRGAFDFDMLINHLLDLD